MSDHKAKLEAFLAKYQPLLEAFVTQEYRRDREKKTTVSYVSPDYNWDPDNSDLPLSLSGIGDLFDNFLGSNESEITSATARVKELDNSIEGLLMNSFEVLSSAHPPVLEMRDSLSIANMKLPGIFLPSTGKFTEKHDCEIPFLDFTKNGQEFIESALEEMRKNTASNEAYGRQRAAAGLHPLESHAEYAKLYEAAKKLFTEDFFRDAKELMQHQLDAREAIELAKKLAGEHSYSTSTAKSLTKEQQELLVDLEKNARDTNPGDITWHYKWQHTVRSKPYNPLGLS